MRRLRRGMGLLVLPPAVDPSSCVASWHGGDGADVPLWHSGRWQLPPGTAMLSATFSMRAGSGPGAPLQGAARWLRHPDCGTAGGSCGLTLCSHPAQARPAPLRQEEVLNANKMPFAKFSLGTSCQRDSCMGRGRHRGQGPSRIGAVGQSGCSVPRADPGGCVGSQRPPGCWWCHGGCVPEGCFPHVVWCAELNPRLFACGTASGSCAGAHVETGFYWHGAEQDAAPGCRMRPHSMCHCLRSPRCGHGWGPSSAAPRLRFISSAGLWGSRLRFLLLHCDAGRDAGGPVTTEGRGPGLCPLPPFPWQPGTFRPQDGCSPRGEGRCRGATVWGCW